MNYLIVPNKNQFTVFKDNKAITTGDLMTCRKFIFFNSFVCNRIGSCSPFALGYEEANNIAHRLWNSMTAEIIESNYPVGNLVEL
jgi:hypothetical protein